jgi:hypothetical protein
MRQRSRSVDRRQSNNHGAGWRGMGRRRGSEGYRRKPKYVVLRNHVPSVQGMCGVRGIAGAFGPWYCIMIDTL